MRQSKFSGIIIEILAIMAVTVILASAAAASEFKVLHAFTWADYPSGKLTMDAAGNLYGTAQFGGAHGSGVVYRLAPNPNGSGTVSILYSFTGGTDGDIPEGGVTFDAAGNLYGTTYAGGGGGGVVYKLAPNPQGSWTESVLHSFKGGTAGANPTGLTFDAAGNLYGATQHGGAPGYGFVYKLAPNPHGSWTESVLYSFKGGTDGAYPQGQGPAFDAAGNLYGTTSGSESNPCFNTCGTVFKLSPNPDGTWREAVLHSFEGGTDGVYPYDQLTFDAAGNLYGVTELGGGSGCYGGGCGVIYKLAPNPDGSWTESVLHSFDGPDGKSPSARLTLDAAGNLYGTTHDGGACGYGVVFKLKPTATGWKETVLHTFVGYGKSPFVVPLIFDRAGNLYGTTSAGTGNNGLVFEITP